MRKTDLNRNIALSNLFNPLHYFWFTSFFVLMGGWSAYWSYNAQYPLSKVAILVLVFVTVFPLVWKLNRKPLDLFESHTIVTLAAFIYFILPAIHLSFFYADIPTLINLTPYSTLLPKDDAFLAKVVWVTVLAMVSFNIGYLLMPDLSNFRKSQVPKRFYSRRVLLVMGFLFTALGILFFVYSMWKVGGAAVWFGTYRSEKIFLVAKSIFSTFGLLIFIPAVVIILSCVFIKPNKWIVMSWLVFFWPLSLFLPFFLAQEGRPYSWS